jgi:hypothetical protein
VVKTTSATANLHTPHPPRGAPRFAEELLITIPLSDSKTIHTIENRGEVLTRDYNGAEVTLRAKIGRRQLDQLRSAGARMRVVSAEC